MADRIVVAIMVRTMKTRSAGEGIRASSPQDTPGTLRRTSRAMKVGSSGSGGPAAPLTERHSPVHQQRPVTAAAEAGRFS